MERYLIHLLSQIAPMLLKIRTSLSCLQNDTRAPLDTRFFSAQLQPHKFCFRTSHARLGHGRHCVHLCILTTSFAPKLWLPRHHLSRHTHLTLKMMNVTLRKSRKLKPNPTKSPFLSPRPGWLLACRPLKDSRIHRKRSGI